MLLFRHLTGSLACLALLGASTLACASGLDRPPPEPLRLVPDQVDVIVEVKHPRQLIEAVTRLDLFQQLLGLPPLAEFFDSTNYRRFYQLVAYFEKQLGARWPDLVDQLAAGGAVLGVKLGPNPAPALLVVQGKDEKLLRRFADLALQIAEQELARQEAKERPEKGCHRNVQTIRIGPEFHAAVAGSALLISNQEESLKHAINLHLDGDQHSMVHVKRLPEARKLLPPDPLALAWLNLETVQKNQQAQNVLKTQRDDVNLTVLFGGWLDVARRSPFLTAGLYRRDDGFVTAVRMPRGREGMGPELTLHVPPSGEPGSRPLLEPKGVVFSHSFYLDVSKFWEDRAKLFNEKQVKTIEEADKSPSRFLTGLHLSKLLTQAGSYHRVVAVNQPKSGYQKKPKQPIPAFAYVVELREPEEFSKSVATALRGIALLAGTQYKLKLVEQKHGNYQIVGYRFPEDAKLPNDVNDIRFNFSPCFVTVGKQFVLCSTLELCHELIDLLEKEAKEKPAGSPAAQRTQLYSTGGALVLKAFEDQLLVQTILGQAVTPDEAKEQVRALIDLVRKLGSLEIEANYGIEDFRYDIRLKLAK